MTTKEDILSKCTVDGNIVKLPEDQLERKLYLEVAKSLNLIGGKWKGGKVQGFVFLTDPTELLSEIANGGNRNLKKEFQFFGTPAPLANYLVELAEVDNSHSILEPSAGQGAMIRAINAVCDVRVDCYELMEVNRIILKKTKLKFNLLGDDFLNHSEGKYDRIIANPPFTKNQDIDHILKMWDCLNDGGRLVSICSTSWFNGSQRKQIQFIQFLDENDAEVLDIEPGAFKESGTNVGGKIIILSK